MIAETTTQNNTTTTTSKNITYYMKWNIVFSDPDRISDTRNKHEKEEKKIVYVLDRSKTL